MRRWVHALGKRDHAFENEGFDAFEKGFMLSRRGSRGFEKWGGFMLLRRSDHAFEKGVHAYEKGG